MRDRKNPEIRVGHPRPSGANAGANLLKLLCALLSALALAGAALAQDPPSSTSSTPGVAPSGATSISRRRPAGAGADLKPRAGLAAPGGGTPATPAAGRGSKTAGAGSKTSGAQGPFSALGLSGEHGPIDIQSDQLELDYKANMVLYRGHVRATQGSAALSSDTLKVVYSGNFHDIRQVVAQGHVRLSQGGRWATGEQAVLNQTNHTVEMTGQPVLHDGPDQVAGSRILIYLDSQKSVVERARAVLYPSKGEDRDEQAPTDHGP